MDTVSPWFLIQLRKVEVSVGLSAFSIGVHVALRLVVVHHVLGHGDGLGRGVTLVFT